MWNATFFKVINYLLWNNILLLWHVSMVSKLYTAIPLQAVKYLFWLWPQYSVVHELTGVIQTGHFTFLQLAELSLRMFLCNILLWNNTWRELQGILLIIVVCALILAFTSWKQCLIRENLSMEVKRSMTIEY